MKTNKAIRFLEMRNIKGGIDFGCFAVRFETEKGLFSVSTDKLHHPEWYGMVRVDFGDEGIQKNSMESKEVFYGAWCCDERLIAALAELTSTRKKEIDIAEPSKEYARKVFEELHIPNAPGGQGMLTQLNIFGNADYLDANGRVMNEHDREIERFMVSSGMTREQAKIRWKAIHPPKRKKQGEATALCR